MKPISIAMFVLTALPAAGSLIQPFNGAAIRIDMNGDVTTTPGGSSTASLSRALTFSGFNIGVSGAAISTNAQWAASARSGGSFFLNGINYNTLGYSVASFATISDNLMVAQGSFIEIPVHVTGAIASSASASGGLPAGSTVSSVVQLGGICSAYPFDGLNYLPGKTCTVPSFTFKADQTFDQTLLVRVPVVPNLKNTLQLTWVLSASLGFFANGSSNLGVSFQGVADGDFSHTGVLLPAQVLDANGNVIPGAIITSDSGFDYNNPFGATAAVPEPGSVLLLGTGLAALLASGAVQRKSRAKTLPRT